MTNVNRAEQLAEAVARALALNNTAKFRQNWDLYKQATEVSEIKGLFIRMEEDEGYCNIAIIGDGRVVDIEGDDRDGSGDTILFPFRAVSEVIFHRGSLPSLRRSTGALLIVIARIIGREQSGPYWAAKTPEEEEQLMVFARTLVQAVSE